MDSEQVYRKFGGHYIADEMTFKMGIDVRFADHLASRFKGFRVLETCAGGGFSTIALAKYAGHVFSFEIEGDRLKNTIKNVEKAQMSDKVTFIKDDVLNCDRYGFIRSINAAFMDPDWTVAGPDHIYRFLDSNTKPPSDTLFHKIYGLTKNILLIQPPFIPRKEYRGLPPHEYESLYMKDHVELVCLHFGDIRGKNGESEYRVY